MPFWCFTEGRQKRKNLLLLIAGACHKKYALLYWPAFFSRRPAINSWLIARDIFHLFDRSNLPLPFFFFFFSTLVSAVLSLELEEREGWFLLFYLLSGYSLCLEKRGVSLVTTKEALTIIIRAQMCFRRWKDVDFVDGVGHFWKIRGGAPSGKERSFSFEREGGLLFFLLRLLLHFELSFPRS